MNKPMTLTALFLAVVVSTSCAADTVSVPVKGLPLPYSVSASVYSQDGLQRVDGCSDGTLRIYNSADLSLIKTIPLGASAIVKVQYSFDNAAVFAVGRDSTLAFVQIVGDTVTNYSDFKAAAYNAVAYSNDSHTVLSRDPTANTFSVWNLEAGTMKTLHWIGTQAVFTPDGSNILAVYPSDSSAQIRTIDSDSILHTYKIPGQAVAAAAISPDMKKFVVPVYSGYLGAQNSLVVMDVETGQVIKTILAQTSDRWVLMSWTCKGLAFSSDGTKIIVGDNDVVAAWDVVTGNRVIEIENIDADRLDGWFTADGAAVISHTRMTGQYLDSMVRWNLSPYKKTVLFVRQDRPRIQASGFSATGDDLYIGSYSYSEMTSYVGLMKWDSTVFWNGKTGGEFERREYVQQDPAYEYLSGWVFTPDGKRLIEKHMTYYASKYTSNGISIYTITDSAGKPSGRYYGQPALSPDRRFVYLFYPSSYTILDVYTLDTVTKAFNLPSEWEALAVHPQKNLVCAYKKTQKDQFSDVNVTVGIWDLGSDSSMVQFGITSYDWIDHDEVHLVAEFTPDGAHLILQTNGHYYGGADDISLYNVQTGAREVSYPVTKPLKFACTPDGKMLLVGSSGGMYCFNAGTGKLLRFYDAPLPETYSLVYVGYVSSAFSFNPANPRQFITGNTIWELPMAIPVKNQVVKDAKTSFRVFVASTNRVSIIMPAENLEADFTLYQLDGREIVRCSLPKSGQSHRSLALPGLAHGMYLYRFETAGNAFRAQGSLLMP
jgi:WD40 repeat protein